jgi:hypothetical protein
VTATDRGTLRILVNADDNPTVAEILLIALNNRPLDSANPTPTAIDRGMLRTLDNIDDNPIVNTNARNIARSLTVVKDNPIVNPADLGTSRIRVNAEDKLTASAIIRGTFLTRV